MYRHDRRLLTSLLNVILEKKRGSSAGGAIRIRQCVRRDRDRARFELAITISRESGASLLEPIKKGEREKERGIGEEKGLV